MRQVLDMPRFAQALGSIEYNVIWYAGKVLIQKADWQCSSDMPIYSCLYRQLESRFSFQSGLARPTWPFRTYWPPFWWLYAGEKASDSQPWWAAWFCPCHYFLHHLPSISTKYSSGKKQIPFIFVTLSANLSNAGVTYRPQPDSKWHTGAFCGAKSHY